MRRGLCRDAGVAVVSDPRGDEPPYADESWDDDIDFEALDCVELECEEIEISERGDEPPYGEWLADDPHFNAWLDYANERNT